MTDVVCPCCAGSGKIAIVSAPKRGGSFTTATSLAARLGYHVTTITKHIKAGVLRADVGEVLVPYRRGETIIQMPRPCYMIRREDAAEYERQILERRARGQRVVNGRGAIMLAMHEQGHSDEVIAERFGIKPVSARRTYLRAKEKA